MYDRILIPVDGSECALRAAEYGLGVARAYGATVEFVSVVDTSRFLPVLSDDEERRRYREVAEDALDEARELAASAGVDAGTECLVGRPARAIVDRAADGGADLVAMGKQGRRGLSKYLVGSTTTAVLRTAAVPVLAVPDGDRTGSAREGFGDVLYPTDGSDAAARAADHAASVADRFDVPLHVLNAVDIQAAAGPFSAGGVDREWVDRLLDGGEATVEEAAARIREADPDADLRTAVVRGVPHAAIGEYVAEAGVGLVAMGSHGRSALGRGLLGSTTERVVAAGVAPVLVVR
jgi:nucleotide-binding universal stress UspA family protein